LTLGYTAWSQIYEVGPLNEYPIDIRYTNEGEMKLNRAKAGIKDFTDNIMDASANSKAKLDAIDKKIGLYEAPKKVIDAAKSTYKYWD